MNECRDFVPALADFFATYGSRSATGVKNAERDGRMGYFLTGWNACAARLPTAADIRGFLAEEMCYESCDGSDRVVFLATPADLERISLELRKMIESAVVTPVGNDRNK